MVGARQYDPGLGRFTSVDAVLAPANPQQNNGYSYAANNPVTMSDPTGNDPHAEDCSGGCHYVTFGGITRSVANAAPAAAGNGKSRSRVPAIRGFSFPSRFKNVDFAAVRQRQLRESQTPINWWDVAIGAVDVGIVVLSAVELIPTLGLDGVAVGAQDAALLAAEEPMWEAAAERDAQIAEKVTSKTYQTYTKVNPTTGQVYSGRTSGTGTPQENVAARDVGHAYNNDGFGPAQLDRSSNDYATIRGREQNLIDHYRGQGISANKINGISPRNPRGNWYMNSSESMFGPMG